MTHHYPYTTKQPGLCTSPRLLLVLLALLLTQAACSDLPVMDDLSAGEFPFATETGDSVSFPESFAGKILVVSYIYTHCPDICLMTTSSLDSLRLLLGNRDDVLFLSVSLDPRRDTPAVLREYADIHDIDTRQWHLLSGPLHTTDSLLARIGYVHRKSFIDHNDDGEEVYFIDHSDFITLIDRHGRLRSTYSGTEPDFEKVIRDINTLGRE